MKEIIETINNCCEQYMPMESKTNLFLEYLILKEHQPKKIIEIGTGAAGWALTINQLFRKDKLEFALFENFDQTNYKDYEWWPKSKKELEDYIKSKNSKFKFTLEEKYNKVENADVIRFDAWGISFEEYKNIISHLKEDSIILFDDVAFHKDIDLIIITLELARQKLIYPIWGSNTVTCWSRSKSYSKHMIFHLNKHASLVKNFCNLKLKHSTYELLDYNFSIIQTKHY
jgi:hypothetical protein